MIVVGVAWSISVGRFDVEHEGQVRTLPLIFMHLDHCRISGAIVLELGGGVGLSSLAAALYANTVICTGEMWVGLCDQFTCSSVDTGDEVLELCSKNIHCNIESLGSDLISGEVGMTQ